MLLRLWNYLRGYVIINVSGFSVERFLNLAANKGIYIWDLHYTNDGISMKVSIKGFRELKGCAKKTKCRIKIASKCGLPFRASKYKKRKLFLVGMALFAVFMFVSSLFVWTIDIIGNERITREELISFCEEAGLTTGTLKYNLNSNELTQKLILRFPDISWAAVSVNGTSVNISIVETIKKTTLIEKDTPCHIVAAKSGIVYSIITKNGTPRVAQKDVVKQGDILVSSEIVYMAEETPVKSEYVHADAEVVAKTWYNLDVTVPYIYKLKEDTGNTMTHYSTSLFGTKIGIRPKIKYELFDVTALEENIVLFGEIKLGAKIKKDIIKEYKLIPKRYTENEAKDKAIEMFHKKISEGFDVNIEVLSSDYTLEVVEKGVILKGTVAVLERIDEKLPVTSAMLVESGE